MLSNAPCSFIGWTILFKHFALSSIKYLILSVQLHSALFYYLISIKNLTAFVLFLVLHHFSVFIYLYNTDRSAPTYMSFRRNLKTYLFNQTFPTKTAFPVRNHLWLWLCFVHFGQVGFEPHFTGGVSNL